MPVCSARYQVHGGDVCARHAGNALREQKERGQKKTSARGARDWAAQGQRSRSRANTHACACLLAIARAGVVCVCVFPFGIVSGARRRALSRNLFSEPSRMPPVFAGKLCGMKS